MKCKVIIEDELGYTHTFYGETTESPTVTTDMSCKGDKFTLNMILTASSKSRKKE
jgi:hypothetical protein